ncbi:MAG TPA: hypothetical protein VJB87_01900 [Candidatus Nanoarchaeia archaeon]|nr:hypothetical protein [Candidatus Nanoarchaeia archaeon]
MATPISTSLISFFIPIFVFLLVFLGTYAVLTKIKFFGNNKGLLALMALITGLIFMLYQPGRMIVMVGTPWIIFFTIVLTGIIGMLLFFGVKEQDISTFMGGGFMVTIIVSAVIILFLVLVSKVYGPVLMVDNAPTFWGGVKRTLFTHKVLGAAFLITIAAYAMKIVSDETSK